MFGQLSREYENNRKVGARALTAWRRQWNSFSSGGRHEEFLVDDKTLRIRGGNKADTAQYLDPRVTGPLFHFHSGGKNDAGSFALPRRPTSPTLKLSMLISYSHPKGLVLLPPPWNNIKLFVSRPRNHRFPSSSFPSSPLLSTLLR